ncbi:SDR family oxidoreductase [bacterium]|nr:SDR family oxidoreductase [bacterium]
MPITLITGGSRGIGRATALTCAQRGHGVILTYNTHPDEARTVVDSITEAGGKAVALQLDVADAASFPAFAGSVTRALRDIWACDRFDHLVNNAGLGVFAPIEEVTPSLFDTLMNVHLKGPFFLTQALLPLLAEGGSIVNVSSASVRVATPGVAPYAAFKGGLEVLTRYMAKEFAGRRIRANAVAPGGIRTDLADRVLDRNPEILALVVSQTAGQRVGEPEDVAGVIVSLTDPANGWINAQTIEVSGGFMI